MLVTPILGSLTVSYSDDTIILDYASKFNQLILFLSLFSFFFIVNLIVFVFVHLIYYDYEIINETPDLIVTNHRPAAVT